MKDKFRDDQPSKPNAGVVKIHDHKGNASHPSHGGVAHPEKVGKGESISAPSHGGTLHREKADGKNRVEPVANPQGGKEEIPREHLHSEKTAADDAKTYEPKPAGKTNSSGHKFATTKRD